MLLASRIIVVKELNTTIAGIYDTDMIKLKELQVNIPLYLTIYIYI